MKNNFIQISIIIVLLFILILITYFYINIIERNKVLIRFYPAQVFLERQAIRCSSNSPSWLKDVILKTTKTHQAPNNQIAYLTPKGELFHCESGYLGMPLFSEKVEENTRFRYASVSKLWASDAILDLIKQKKIQLDTPILKVLPSIPKPQDMRIAQITIGDLLLHRAGFQRTGLMGDEMFKSGQIPFCPSALNRLSEQQLSFTPNTTFSYSNLGYCLLGEIVASKEKIPYQQAIEKKYALAKDGIKFLQNVRYPDEAKYRYIELSLTSHGDIYTAFDYPSLASSAGLSGSASALAFQVQNMIKKNEPNILSQPNISCNITKLRDCYGYAMFPYQKDMKSLKVYFRDGTLLGASSLVVVDEHGGIVTLLSSGQAALGHKQYDQTKMLVYSYLEQQYR